MKELKRDSKLVRERKAVCERERERESVSKRNKTFSDAISTSIHVMLLIAQVW